MKCHEFSKRLNGALDEIDDLFVSTPIDDTFGLGLHTGKIDFDTPARSILGNGASCSLGYHFVHDSDQPEKGWSLSMSYSCHFVEVVDLANEIGKCLDDSWIRQGAGDTQFMKGDVVVRIFSQTVEGGEQVVIQYDRFGVLR